MMANTHVVQMASQKSVTAIISTNVTITATHLKTTNKLGLYTRPYEAQ